MASNSSHGVWRGYGSRKQLATARDQSPSALRKGDAAWVFSLSEKSWFLGEVVDVLAGSLVRVEFRVGQDRCRKTLHVQSDLLAIPSSSKIAISHFASQPSSYDADVSRSVDLDSETCSGSEVYVQSSPDSVVRATEGGNVRAETVGHKIKKYNPDEAMQSPMFSPPCKDAKMDSKAFATDPVNEQGCSSYLSDADVGRISEHDLEARRKMVVDCSAGDENSRGTRIAALSKPAQQPGNIRVFQGCRDGLPVECQGDPAKYYRSMEYIWTLLREERIVLITGSWLLAQSKAVPFVPLPACQDLPPEARVDLKALDLVAKVLTNICRWPSVVAISHCWLNENHPDPDGLLLQELAPVIEAYVSSLSPLTSHDGWQRTQSQSQKVDNFKVEDALDKVEDSSGEVKNKGVREFSGAFFFAWCSLYQPYHKRGSKGTYKRVKDPQWTDAQKLSHQRGLENMDIWYTHQFTEVWLLTKYFDGQGKAYDDRGWPTWERAVANLLSGGDRVLDIGKLGSGLGHSMRAIRDACSIARTPPLAREKFDDVIDRKFFTCGQSDRDLIKRNYARNLGHALGCVERLDFMNIPWDGTDWASFFTVLRLCRSLQMLSLSSNLIGDTGARGLADGLQHCQNLFSLKLSGNQIGDAGARGLADGLQHCQNLKSLELDCNQIGDAGARGLGDGLQHCQALEELELRRNQIGDAGARGLADGLQHCQNLERLALSGNQIGDAGARGLADGLQHCQNLKLLELSCNQIGDAGARGLADCLQHWQSLFQLQLNGNQIGDAGARGLADGLQHCQKLSMLELNCNQIGDAGARGLADSLQHCQNLFSLLLYGNQIGDAGARGLADCLQHCQSLYWLQLNGNQIGDAGARWLADGLQHSQHLRELQLNGNQIGGLQQRWFFASQNCQEHCVAQVGRQPDR